MGCILCMPGFLFFCKYFSNLFCLAALLNQNTGHLTCSKGVNFIVEFSFHYYLLEFATFLSWKCIICLFMKFCWWTSSTVKSIRHCKLQYFTCSDSVVVLGLLFWRSTPNPSSWVDSLWQNAYSARNQRSVSLMVLQQYYLWPIFYS